jgi:hypothetical protein
MAARPGEEIVATLFGDIHYFYAPETTSKPQHHRFDKGSYVYLYENASTRRARVEIANHPGTEDQDAFDGFLDHVRLRYTHKHHCLVTLTVVANPLPNAQEWHLPSYDPRNENKYHYPLHAIDIYFWTRADALQFVNGARRVLPATQCEVLDEPSPAPQSPSQAQAHQLRGHPPAHDGPVNAVVQRLENAAISRHGSNASSAAPSFAGPPGADATSSTSNFAPMAYNPAAPAAPETIRHREKTPPPPQDPSSDPRAVAAAYEQHGQHGQAPFSPAPFSPFLQQHHLQPMASPAFPPHMQQQHQQSLASPGFAPPGYGSAPPPPPPPPPGPLGQGAPGRAGTMPTSPMPPATAGSGYYPGSPGFAPQGMQSMHPPGMAQAGAPPPPPQGQPAQSQPQPQTPGVGGDYGLHHQVYQPEGSAAAGKKEGKGRLEENAGRLERGVSGMFKKFEKKFG